MKSQSGSSKNFKRRVVFTIICVVLVLLVVVGIVVVKGITVGNQTPVALSPTTTPAQNEPVSSTSIPNVKVSPLLFGTNLGLFTSNDQVVTSAATRTLMQQIHIRIVRVPMRTHLSNDVEIQAVQAVKSIGAIPLIVLTGVRNPNVLADDMRMIKDMNSVFGNSLVYYEFNHDNLTTFLQEAKPRPDAISWHEYTCSYQDPADSCLAHLDRWTTHINDGRSVMQTTLGTELPITITEL